MAAHADYPSTKIIYIAMHTLEQLRSGQLAGITRLDLSADLKEFPREIFALADSLEILNLTGNQLDSLPDDLPRLSKLKIIFCSENQFTALPTVLGQCEQLEMVGFKANQIRHVPAESLPTQLRWLILTDNQITQLPAQIGQCARLKKADAGGQFTNRVTQFISAMRPSGTDPHRRESIYCLA
ncbi:leucine-rich repeat domain-containing protein [Chitinibacter bivalviorum]|uniref:leucine-rich repeat domain-containing protein n=1 Tax=Chitinibacter bivalviorum TaxID=2739434 RepID=UPI001C537F42|nr:hypothetical protein [Chitinibacter bivalviorum]